MGESPELVEITPLNNDSGEVVAWRVTAYAAGVDLLGRPVALWEADFSDEVEAEACASDLRDAEFVPCE